MATLNTTKARFVAALVDISKSNHSFAEALRKALVTDKLTPEETAKVASLAAVEYFDRSLRALTAALLHDDKLPTGFDAIPEYKAVVNAINHGSRIMARTIGYKIDGNSARVKLSAYAAGDAKVFAPVKVDKEAKAPKTETAKGKASAAAIPAAPVLSVDAQAGIIRQHEKTLDVVACFELALKKAKRSKRDMVALVDCIQRELGMVLPTMPEQTPVSVATALREKAKKVTNG
jgi:hypothetical protein